MAVTIANIGAQAIGAGSITPAIGITPVADTDLMLLFAASNSNAETMTVTGSGGAVWTVLRQGEVANVPITGMALYGRIATASEGNPTITYGGTFSHVAHIVVLRSTTGWGTGTIGSVVGNSDAEGNSSVTQQIYQACAITETGNVGIQWGARSYNNGNTNPVTGVTVTSGWTALGTAIRNNTNAGVCSSAQLQLNIISAIPQNTVTTTGNTTGAAAQRRITVTLRPAAPAVSFLYDASQRVDSPYNLLPLELLPSIGAFSTGDSYQQNGTLVGQGNVSPGNYGVATVTFNNPLTGLLWPGIFHDANGAGDGNYTYVMPLNPPPNEGLRNIVTRQGAWMKRRKFLAS